MTDIANMLERWAVELRLCWLPSSSMQNPADLR